MNFVFLEAITPWVMELAWRMSSHGNVVGLQHYDIRSYRALKPKLRPASASFSERHSVYPPGFAGPFSPLFSPFIRNDVRRARRQLSAGGEEPFVVCAYPYAAPWAREVPDDRLVYFNIDDYTLYFPHKAAAIEKLEDELISRARLTLCVSSHQVRKFRSRHPDSAERILHFPLGVNVEYLNAAPETPPQPDTVGYVGNLGDRVDWAFAEETILRTPELTYEFVGKRTGNEDDAWAQRRKRVFDLPNVRYLGPVPQSEVYIYYWRSAVNWMPYDTRHPFNIACCPTKILDSLASGRSLVSSDLPECRNYPDYVQIAESPEAAADLLRKAVDRHDALDARARRDFAATNTWVHRAERLSSLLQ